MDAYFHGLYRPKIEAHLFRQVFQAVLARRTFNPYADFDRAGDLVHLEDGFHDLMTRLDELHAEQEIVPSVVVEAMTAALQPYKGETPVKERIDRAVASSRIPRAYYEAFWHDIRDDEAFYALFPDLDRDRYSMRVLHGAFRGHAVMASLRPLDPTLYRIGLRSHMTRLIGRALFHRYDVRPGECDDLAGYMLDIPRADESNDPLNWVHTHWALAGRLDDATLDAIREGVTPYKTDSRLHGLDGDAAHDLLFGGSPRNAYVSELVLDLLDIEAHPELYVDIKP